MAVNPENPGPYAPASAITDIIDRYRNRGLSKPFTPEVLARAGVSDSLIPRTLQTLQTIDLIDEAGNPTEMMEALRRAAESDFKKQMGAWITHAYAEVLQFVNASDDETAIRDAFRNYNPIGQQPRMVALFLGLCRAAGLRSDDQSTAKARPAARKPGISGIGTVTRKNGTITPPTGAMGMSSAGVPAPLAGLLSKLPPENGTWTAQERDKFIATFTAVLDFCFNVDEKQQEGAKDGN